MNYDHEFLAAMLFAVIITTFLVTIITCMHYYVALGKRKARHHLLYLSAGMLFSVCCWQEVLFIMMNLKLAIYLDMPLLLCSMLAIVTLYHFLYFIIGSGQRLHFSPWHYIVPVILTAGMSVWTYTGSTWEERERLTFSMEPIDWDAPLFDIVYPLQSIMFTIYGIIYGVLALRRFNRYKKTINNYAANEERTSLGWIQFFLIIVACSLTAPALSVLSPNLSIPFGWHAILFIIPMGTVYLGYNVVKGNYVLIQALPDSQTEEQTTRVTRYRFEHYMKEKKPYLNPELCITDMLHDLCTNRTYLSNFINQEYGVNFKTLINDYRLNELKTLRMDAANRGKSTLELLKAAGFSSYRSYRMSHKNKYEKSRSLNW
jgi:AraC-like DNA-binding protein